MLPSVIKDVRASGGLSDMEVNPDSHGAGFWSLMRGAMVDKIKNLSKISKLSTLMLRTPFKIYNMYKKRQ